MAPRLKRIIIYTLIIAFVVFLALGLYIELKGRIYDDQHTTAPVYHAGPRPFSRSVPSERICGL